jgi:dsRNA-specific ribonuclease
VEEWAAKHIWSVALETIEGRQWIDPRQRLRRSLAEVKGPSVVPVYKLVREYGAAHNKTFTVRVPSARDVFRLDLIDP